MGRNLTRDDIRESLVRHDPLGAWDPRLGGQSDYADEATIALADMTHPVGLGHIITVVADAVDRRHPGFYAACRRGERDVVVSMAAIGRELWDIHGIMLYRKTADGRATSYAPEALLSPAPASHEIADNPRLLIDWLRSCEAALMSVPSNESSWHSQAAMAFRRELPALVDTFGDADVATCEAIREAFSRFTLALYQLSAFARYQYRAMASGDGAPLVALRRALSAESMLDMGTDWRGELMMLRDLRRSAEALGLPFADEVEKAAQRSSAATAKFLRDFANE